VCSTEVVPRKQAEQYERNSHIQRASDSQRAQNGERQVALANRVKQNKAKLLKQRLPWVWLPPRQGWTRSQSPEKRRTRCRRPARCPQRQKERIRQDSEQEQPRDEKEKRKRQANRKDYLGERVVAGDERRVNVDSDVGTGLAPEGRGDVDSPKDDKEEQDDEIDTRADNVEHGAILDTKQKQHRQQQNKKRRNRTVERTEKERVRNKQIKETKDLMVKIVPVSMPLMNLGSWPPNELTSASM
jgi:hypothetical protein